MDHVSGVTGTTLTITTSKDGAAFGAITPTVTERGNGWYWLALTTGHVDTLGGMAYHVTASGCDNADWADEVVVDLPGTGVDVTKIANDANAATNLKNGTLGNVLVTVGTGSTTSSIVTGALPPAAVVADQFKGRVITFLSNTTTANLRGQTTSITSNTSGGVLTVGALSDAPVNGDLAVIT